MEVCVSVSVGYNRFCFLYRQFGGPIFWCAAYKFLDCSAFFRAAVNCPLSTVNCLPHPRPDIAGMALYQAAAFVDGFLGTVEVHQGKILQ